MYYVFWFFALLYSPQPPAEHAFSLKNDNKFCSSRIMKYLCIMISK